MGKIEDPQVEALRAQVNVLDQQIVSLLNTRLQVVDQIADWKQQHHCAVADEERERQVLSQVRANASHPVLREAIQEIYACIIKYCKISQTLKQCPASPFSKIGIAGLGLMGGSVLKAIKAQDPKIVVSALEFASPDLEQARASSLVDRWHATLEALCAETELIVLAGPTKTVPQYAEQLARITAARPKSRPLIVCDLASVKSRIVSSFEKCSHSELELVATHPMCGKECQGFSHSSSLLFASAPWIIVPHSKNQPHTLQRMETWIAFLGGRPLYLDPQKHDQYTALVSHFPGLLSEALLHFVQLQQPESLQIAGPGFQSMTRLAHDNPEMRQQILEENSAHIRECFQHWHDYLQEKKLL